MFEGKSLFEILALGGPTVLVLILASILSLAVIIYKLYEFREKSKVSRDSFIAELVAKMKKGSYKEAISMCEEINSPMAPVAKAGLHSFVNKEGTMNEAMQREVMIQTVVLEKYTTILGTIGSIAVYIGLFGTVLGIISAFHDISAAGTGGISVVIGGVSEALIATATGLFVAVPAVIAYNFLTKIIDKFVVDMEYTSSTIEDFLSGNKK